MATEEITIPITGDVSGSHYGSGDEDDTQIVTFTDGGDLNGKTIKISKFGKGSPSETGEGPGGDDVFKLDLSQFNDNFAMEVKSLQSGDQFQISGWDSREVSGSVITYRYTGSDGQPHVFTFDRAVTNNDESVEVVCFAAGTMIETQAGPRAVETLAPGDMVRCGDGECRPVRWAGSRRLSGEELRVHPHLRPVVLQKDALGRGCPEADLWLSPQHRVLLEGWRHELLFGEPSVLVAAKHLVNDSTIRQRDAADGITYCHILLDTHETVLANGLKSETLFPAEMMNTAFNGAARQEISEIFPDFVFDMGSYGQPAARGLRRFETAAL